MSTYTPVCVSILINNYNNGPWLRQCVDSALNQALPPDEVIVYDDGSTDESLEILRSYGGRIKLIEGVHDAERTGRASAANAIAKAFEFSRGRHVYLLDGDDAFFPTHISCYEAVWREDPKVTVVHGPMEIIDAAGRFVSLLYKKERHCRDYVKYLYRHNDASMFYPTSALAFHRNFLNERLPLDFSDGLNYASDLRLSMAALLSGRIACVDQPQSYYRTRAHSLSAQAGARHPLRALIECTNCFNATARRMGRRPICLWLNCAFWWQVVRMLTPRPIRRLIHIGDSVSRFLKAKVV